MGRRPMASEALLAYVAGRADAPLAVLLGPALASAAARAFVEAHRDKIRKKARGARDEESRRDLAFEVWLASRLVADRRIALDYEPRGGPARTPDFRLAWRGRPACWIEASRVRSAPADPRRAVARALAGKVGQLAPAAANVVALAARASAADLDAALALVAAADDRGVARRLARLSAIVAVPEGGGPAVLRRNPRARHPLAPALERALAAALTAAADT